MQKTDDYKQVFVKLNDQAPRDFSETIKLNSLFTFEYNEK